MGKNKQKHDEQHMIFTWFFPNFPVFIRVEKIKLRHKVKEKHFFFGNGREKKNPMTFLDCWIFFCWCMLVGKKLLGRKIFIYAIIQVFCFNCKCGKMEEIFLFMRQFVKLEAFQLCVDFFLFISFS